MTGGTDRVTVLTVGTFGDPVTPPGRVIEEMAAIDVRAVAESGAVREAADGDAVVLAGPHVEGAVDLRARAPDLPIVLVGEAAAMPADLLDEPSIRAVLDDGTDRTARIVAQHLRELTASHRAATVDIASIPLPAFVHDGGFRAVNTAFSDCVGRPAAALIGAPVSSVFDQRAADLASAATEGRPLSVTLPSEESAPSRSLRVGRDGERLVSVLGAPTGADGGTHPSVSMLDSLLEAMPLSIFVKDRRGRHVAVSHALVGGMADDTSTIDAPDGTIHHVPADVIGKTDFDLYPDANAERFRETDERVVETGEPVIERENVRLTADEQRFAVTDLKVPWYRDGEVVGVIGIAIDDTDSWRAKRRAAIQADVLDTVETILRTDLASRLASDDPDDRPAIRAAVADLQTLLQTRTLPDAAAATDLADRARAVWTGAGDRGPDEGSGPGADATLDVVDSAVIDAHPGLLETLLAELFENASTYAGPDPTVRIGTIDEGVFVADDGPGIPPGRRSEVVQYGASEREDRLGSGLAVVAAIARAHGWDLTISDGPRGGARFTFTGVRIY